MVARIGRLGHELPHGAIRPVLSLPFLVLNHTALLVQFGLIDGSEQMAHAVGLHPQRHIQRRRRDVLEVVGPIGIRRPVHVGGAGPLERPEVFVVVVLGPVEHQMLEQVGEAGPAPLLVLGAHVVPHVHGHDWGLVVFVNDHREPVVEHELLERDLHVVHHACPCPTFLSDRGQWHGEGRRGEYIAYRTLGSHLHLSRVGKHRRGLRSPSLPSPRVMGG